MDHRLYPVPLQSILTAISTYLTEDRKESAAKAIRSSRAEIVQVEYDNWNGGTYHYCLQIHISPEDFISLGSSTIQDLNSTIQEKLTIFSKPHPNHIIGTVSITPTKIDNMHQSLDEYQQQSSLSTSILSFIALAEKKRPGVYVEDSEIAQELGVEIQDVRDWIDIFESEDKVQTANTFGGYSALLTARGRLFLKNAINTTNAEFLARSRQRPADEASFEMSILFLAADPSDTSRLRISAEFREISEKLKLAKLREIFRLELPQLALRPWDISQALLELRPQIVHFSGHGTSEGAIFFENALGQSHLVRPDALGALFEQFSSDVHCVVLNTCFSNAQAEAIAEHVPYVIGMRQAISDDAAIAFAIGFYQALGAGRTIESAYNLGCVQIRLHGIDEHLTPVLIKKIDVPNATNMSRGSNSVANIGDDTEGDTITVGNINNSIGIAIGHGASSTVHIHASPKSETQKSPLNKILDSYADESTNLNLNPTDIELFTFACELSLASAKSILSSEELKEKAGELHLIGDDFIEIIRVLLSQGLVENKGSSSGTVVLKITPKGFVFYAKHNIKDFSTILANTLKILDDGKLQKESELASKLDRTLVFTNYLLNLLDELNLYESPRFLGSNGSLGKITAGGKRLAVKLS